MTYHGHNLQSAVDYVGQLCAETIDNFEKHKGLVPSWGPEVDSMVADYIQGLQDWIVGWVPTVFSQSIAKYSRILLSSLHWSFQTHRYFGTRGQIVKKNRHIRLLPVRKPKRQPAQH